MLTVGSVTMVTAWVGETPVGLARSLTDFSYVCYLADLAAVVDRFSPDAPVLLVGESGCGKTLMAKAIAGEADVPFFSGWSGSWRMHLKPVKPNWPGRFRNASRRTWGRWTTRIASKVRSLITWPASTPSTINRGLLWKSCAGHLSLTPS